MAHADLEDIRELLLGADVRVSLATTRARRLRDTGGVHPIEDALDVANAAVQVANGAAAIAIVLGVSLRSLREELDEDE